MFVALLGMVLWKKDRKLFATEPGKCLYIAELWEYTSRASTLLFLFIYFLFVAKDNGYACRLSGIVLLVTAAVVPASIIITKNRIQKDKYSGRKNIDNRIIEFYYSINKFPILLYGIMLIVVVFARGLSRDLLPGAYL